MAINEHQLAESSNQHRCGSMLWCSCSVCASLGALLLLPRSEEMQTDAL